MVDRDAGRARGSPGTPEFRKAGGCSGGYETLRLRWRLQFPTRAERLGRLPYAASLRERLWPEFEGST